MNDFDLSEYIAHQLFAVPDDRIAPNARTLDIEATAHGVEPTAIELVVGPTLQYLGFVSVIGKPTDTEYVYATLHNRNKLSFVSITWDVEEDFFNPYVHMEHFEIPPSDIKYITGPTPGVPAFN